MENTSDLKLQLAEILLSNGIKDTISEIEVITNAPELKGAGMASLIELVSISFTDSSKPNLGLFLKRTIPTGSDEMVMGFKMVAQKEGQILTEFVNDMVAFCKERTGSADLIRGLYPRVYHCDQNLIVMDNLIKQNYTMLPKLDKQDLETAKLALTNLAKFHAATYGIISKHGGRAGFEEKYTYIVDYWMKPGTAVKMNAMIDSTFMLICSILEKAGAGDPEAEKVSQILKKRLGNCFTEMMECTTCEEIFPVVNHGDFWNNNMMFRNGKQKTDREIVFVDFQNCRIGSPNLDLGYYIFTTAKPEVRKKWKELLECYFNQFEESALKLKIDFPYQFNDFVDDFKRKAKLGFFLGLMLVIGYEAMEDREMDKESGGDVMDNFQAMLTSFVEKNPDKCTKICEEMKEIVADYQLFDKL